MATPSSIQDLFRYTWIRRNSGKSPSLGGRIRTLDDFQECRTFDYCATTIDLEEKKKLDYFFLSKKLGRISIWCWKMAWDVSTSTTTTSQHRRQRRRRRRRAIYCFQLELKGFTVNLKRRMSTTNLSNVHSPSLNGSLFSLTAVFTLGGEIFWLHFWNSVRFKSGFRLGLVLVSLLNLI